MTNGHDRLYISPSGRRARMTSARDGAGRALWEARRSNRRKNPSGSMRAKELV
jgi:hypothetical protein